MSNLTSSSEAMRDLETAEEFLEFFGIAYDPGIVHVNRLHILQRFHDYIETHAAELPQEEAGQHAFYCGWLARAYQDFVESDARTEKVFKVFHRGDPRSVFVPLADIFK
jgi:nitrogenase-stabilizing/protective protein